MSQETDVYASLGVDAGKGNVRSTFRKVIDNDFPGAFVNIVRDPTVPGTVVTQHGDGDGSKSIQRILAYLETDNPRWLAGAVDDAVSMNMSDIAASGFLSGLITWTDNLNLGTHASGALKEEIMEAFARRFSELRALYRQHGFMIKFLGGETADLPDQVGTSVFDVTVNAREKAEDIIKGNVRPGDVIYGFASNGQAAWEDQVNSGIMSNGLTLAGTCLGWSGYNEKYPGLRLKNPFRGRYKVGSADLQAELGGMTVWQAILCPTRQWAFLIRMLVIELKARGILHMLHGISVNTGGGATKIGHVGSGITYEKRMPFLPGIFQLIQREGEVSWKEMYKDFNCGVGLDVVGQDDRRFSDAMMAVANAAQIVHYLMGHTQAHQGEGNRVVLDTSYGMFDY